MIPTERDKKLGCRIAALREARGITLIALAEKMGITVDALAGKERGERPFKLDELVLLTDAFHMSFEELVNETPVDYAKPEDLGLSEEAVQTLRVFHEKCPEGMEGINYLLAYPGFRHMLAEYVKAGGLPDTGDSNAPIEIRKAKYGMYDCKMTPLQYKKIVELALLDLLSKAKAEHDEL